jgi:hypothetical protein
MLKGQKLLPQTKLSQLCLRAVDLSLCQLVDREVLQRMLTSFGWQLYLGYWGKIYCDQVLEKELL